MFRFRTVLRARPFRFQQGYAHRWYTFGAVGLTVAALSIHPDWRQRFVAYNKSITVANVDDDTGVQFPQSLELSPKLSLVGLGVRTVSFLRVKVYSAAFYIEDRVLQSLQKVPGWQTFSAQQIGDEALISTLLQTSDCAIRIVPVRGTDLAHLRDGWVRAIQGRQKLARKRNTISTQDDEDVTKAVQTLKALFPARSVPKGSALVLERSKSGQLRILADDEVLGSMQHEWMSRELFAAYFADDNVISAKLKASVAAGLEEAVRE